MTGTVVLKAPTGQAEKTAQAIEGLGSLEQGADSLQVANDPAYLEGGKTLLKLETGEPWSFAVEPASNPAWHINASELAESETRALSSIATTDAGTILNTPALPLKLTCKGPLSAATPLIAAPNLATAASLTFTECSVIEPTTCKLASTEIKTTPVEATASTATGIADHLSFKTTSKHFAEFILEGSSCSISGKKAATGTVVLKAPTGQAEKTAQAIEGLGSLEQGADSLQVANDPAYLEGGKTLLKLETGEPWSFAVKPSSTPAWHINASELTGPETRNLSTVATTDSGMILNTPALPLKVTCKGPLDAATPLISAPNLAATASLTFTECSVIEPTTCTLASTEIKTEAITGTVSTATGTTDHILFKPTTAKRFAEFILEGGSCSISGKKAATGSVVLKAPTGREESALQAIEGLGSLEQGTASLQVANDRSYLEGGKTLLKLESGEPWSFN